MTVQCLLPIITRSVMATLTMTVECLLPIITRSVMATLTRRGV